MTVVGHCAAKGLAYLLKQTCPALPAVFVQPCFPNVRVKLAAVLFAGKALST